MINLVKTQRKLKAGLSAVINNDKTILRRTKQIYMHSASVFSECSSDEAPQKNEFLEFVQTDEKEKLEEINARILKDKRSIQLIKQAFLSKFKPKSFREEESESEMNV